METKTEALWTLQDVAKYLRCTTRHVQNLKATGLPYIHIGRLVRFDEKDVLDYLKNASRLQNHRRRQTLKDALAQ